MLYNSNQSNKSLQTENLPRLIDTTHEEEKESKKRRQKSILMNRNVFLLINYVPRNSFLLIKMMSMFRLFNQDTDYHFFPFIFGSFLLLTCISRLFVCDIQEIESNFWNYCVWDFFVLDNWIFSCNLVEL